MEAWLQTHRPGQDAGAWPEALNWPKDMTKNVKTVATRWKKSQQKKSNAPVAGTSYAPSAPGGSA